MRNRITILLIVCLVTFVAGTAPGQTEGIYSQYMFNGLAINPAYAGHGGPLNLTFHSRLQSIGLDGAPNTQTFAAHSSLRNDKIGVGLLLANDKIGVTRHTGIYAAYAYKIKFEKAVLSMGLQGGANFINAEYSKLRINQPGDPNFQDGDIKRTKPNFGAGIFFNTKKLYAGISMPQMLGEGDKEVTQLHPFIITGGYVFSVSPGLKIKPNVLMKFVEGRAVEFNYNTNVLIQEVLWIGASFRPANTVNWTGWCSQYPDFCRPFFVAK